SIIFYGDGLALFGQLERYELYCICYLDHSINI
ncbi:MAG: hypothetical protein ACI9OE_002210, partial [Mariniflexile sp.]